MMIYDLSWITYVPYHDMTILCWSHKWTVVMKGHSHVIPNELMTMNIQGVSLQWPILSYDLNGWLKDI